MGGPDSGDPESKEVSPLLPLGLPDDCTLDLFYQIRAAGPPKSPRHRLALTFFLPLSVRRLARTHPPMPPPTMI
jgi:hypothetical protein